ncbi:hypothetical protein EX895_003621 [Sporisorium graminicola]|uniref:Uncharacterized protein n=1 Tax=Sporisorium graminicola TaxID=280036 RepID=A0A4U7KU49_9BASI|nr:hypothetical protein EX895_003621 [Sporisorium graminicola]TKY87607.1 hypothetical protein EX895_003621 [Sporisorium graminicola]
MLAKFICTLLLVAMGSAANLDPNSSSFTSTVAPTKTIRATAPTSSPTGILKYEPSTGGNYFVGGAYALFSATIFFHVFRHKDLWALCLPIGTFFSAIGFFLRPSLDPYNVSLGLYIAQSMCIVISPAAFLAFNYMLYGRMILAVDKNFGRQSTETEALETQPLSATQKITKLHKAGGRRTERSHISFVPPRIVGRVFVCSDIFTFLLQCAAGGLQASGGSDNKTMVNVGDKLYLGAVIMQGISYIFFTLLVTYATFMVIRDGARERASVQHSNTIMGLGKHVFALFSGLYFSSIFIIIRSLYRMIEFAQGYDGYLVSHEIYLFVLDAAPLLLAVGIWVVIWPSTLLERIFEKRFWVAGSYRLSRTASGAH